MKIGNISDELKIKMCVYVFIPDTLLLSTEIK